MSLSDSESESSDESVESESEKYAAEPRVFVNMDSQESIDAWDVEDDSDADPDWVLSQMSMDEL